MGVGRGHRTHARPAAAAVGMAGLVGAVLAGCTAAPTDPVPVPTISAGPRPASALPTGEPSAARALPVYYIADTAAGPRLYREFHQVSTVDPATDAVGEMLGEPAGLDADYRTHWPPTAALRGPVTTGGGVITVDLTGVGPAPVDAAPAPLVVQQLVFTVQAALQSVDPVRILVDGEPVDDLWGVPTADPVRRGDTLGLRSLVQIDEPADGSTVGPEVTVAGEAAVFEATVLWEVLRDGRVVQSGYTTTSEGQKFSPFRFTVQLGPGEYVVRVSEDDPSDGEGRPPLTDDKTITVG
ncbi:Gmad2 immunoglobulin-like domain-containing protein [Pseudonocardia humida]|uniref:GerMN domain-containing protein n=1 Tax=Pseudonocardia humida TaxID=2800819 RepID=A0ABT0ZWR7_9PSEU|nr:Gmad2 immunoglobulin-like domain-containing protein [Pseudonocardia humida]MCO1655084.1 GerMN domain-containing protein [Pseudonocardia humida]